MTTEMKVLSGGMITNYYANGTQRVLPIISLDSSGNLVVEFEGQTGRTVLAIGTAATEYHKFELVFLPGSNPSASFYFDGKLIRDNIQPTASKQNMIVWGMAHQIRMVSPLIVILSLKFKATSSSEAQTVYRPL